MLLLVAALLWAGAGPARATSVYSIWGTYGPILGIPYENRAGVTNNTVMASTFSVASTNGATIPGGWSGGQASLYKDGALCATSSMDYYSSSTTGWTGLGGENNCGHGNYTSRGSTAAYNGSGYSYYYTYTSPILTY